MACQPVGEHSLPSLKSHFCRKVLCTTLEISELLTGDLQSHFDFILTLKPFLILTIFFWQGRWTIRNNVFSFQHALAPHFFPKCNLSLLVPYDRQLKELICLTFHEAVTFTQARSLLVTISDVFLHCSTRTSPTIWSLACCSFITIFSPCLAFLRHPI